MIAIDADLRFSIELPPAGGAPARQVSGTVSGQGAALEVTLDELPALDRSTAPSAVRQLARRAADAGLQVSVRGPLGLVATVGAVRPQWLSRIVLRSRFVRLGSIGTVLAALRARGRRPVSVQDLTPPITLLPLAPTFATLPRRVTTTHDPDGGGRPRFFFPGEVNGLPGQRTHVFYLRVGRTTTVGGDPGDDLQLDGLEPVQAEIRRDEWDEYWVVSTGTEPVRVNGAPTRQARMRTGTRVQIGRWTMVYFRAEYADHGRPYGGRIGGEAGHQIPQPMPTYRRPSGSR